MIKKAYVVEAVLEIKVRRFHDNYDHECIHLYSYSKIDCFINCISVFDICDYFLHVCPCSPTPVTLDATWICYINALYSFVNETGRERHTSELTKTQ